MGCDQESEFKDSRRMGGTNIMQDEAVDLQYEAGVK
jgi:hypothetical protein